jgi:hypothetical protein
MKLQHATREDARRELSAHGYFPLFVPLTEPSPIQPWGRRGGGTRYAIGSNKAGEFYIVEYLAAAAMTSWLD